jgi:8-oxo-dGTP pyrophosphatase MutT (NUDIX family)
VGGFLLEAETLTTPLSKLPGFDAQKAPVLSVDTHLPAVPHERMLEQALRARFMAPPVWQPEFVQERAYLDRPMSRAAVLLGLVMRDEPMVLLTRRANHMSTHSGQVAFPGGKVDPEDTDVRHTALREAHEEVGLNPALVHVLGELPTYTTGSAFVITPVVGLVEPGFEAVANPSEVAQVFEVPLSFLMNPRVFAVSGTPCPTAKGIRSISYGVPRRACCATFIAFYRSESGQSQAPAMMGP